MDASIRLLGRPEFLSGAGDKFFPAKGFQLIAILALSASGKVSRRELATLLWDLEVRDDRPLEPQTAGCKD